MLAVLVPPSSLMAAVSKAFMPLPQKSDRNDAELGKRRQSHIAKIWQLSVALKSLARPIPFEIVFTIGVSKVTLVHSSEQPSQSSVPI